MAAEETTVHAGVVILNQDKDWKLQKAASKRDLTAFSGCLFQTSTPQPFNEWVQFNDPVFTWGQRDRTQQRNTNGVSFCVIM